MLSNGLEGPVRAAAMKAKPERTTGRSSTLAKPLRNGVRRALDSSGIAVVLRLLILLLLALDVTTQATDYAESRHASDWWRHPVYGDPSFDGFVRRPGNPIHRGVPPFEWPVNGFLFEDPVSGHWFIYVGEYGKGYLTPPSRCLLYRSTNQGASWNRVGVVLEGDAASFDRQGHTPDVTVVYADGRYHMVYDWGEPDFTAEGGLAYAWAERPEGPWHRAAEPITRNSRLPKLLGRYQRTYAATLLRRKHDWLILGMMDRAPQGWALFALTAPRPEGPWSERRLVRHVERDDFHPPLLEFFPAFAHGGYAYAPATSVALNRNFNALFRADLEKAHEPEAWRLHQHGSLWHAEDVEHEFHGIWGQTCSGFVDRQGIFQAMFPSRDAEGRGTINLAQRRWSRPLAKHGFVLTGHAGPSLTLLRQAYADFQLEARLEWRGEVELLLDYAAPLDPKTPTSDATLHPLARTRQTALVLADGAWSVARRDAAGKETRLESGRLPDPNHLAIRLERRGESLTLGFEGRPAWSGLVPAMTASERSGVLGWGVAAHTHLVVRHFTLTGQRRMARVSLGSNEALLGAAEAASDWEERNEVEFRFGRGCVSRLSGARAKWNVIGRQVALWSPRGPDFGEVEIRLDGRPVAKLDLRAEALEPSRVVWQSHPLRDEGHALVLTARQGRMPVDSVDVLSGRGRGSASTP